MKIGLVGCGYWGKIILKNLIQLGYKDITVCEKRKIDWDDVGQKFKVVQSYKFLKCDAVFVVTPPETHYEVCKYFLKKGVNVFCEKPLTLDHVSSAELYKEAKRSGASLFVDWVFIYNPCVRVLRDIIQDRGKPKNIIANRLNYGPVRKDVNARWDLASHDVSIATFLLSDTPKSVSWLDFKRNNTSDQNDSVVGVLSYEDTNLQINASWEYGKKDRLYSLEFENGFVYWDDNDKTVTDNFTQIEVPNYSPLHKSIKTFINNDFDQKQQMNLTLDTTRILENESKL